MVGCTAEEWPTSTNENYIAGDFLTFIFKRESLEYFDNNRIILDDHFSRL